MNEADFDAKLDALVDEYKQILKQWFKPSVANMAEPVIRSLIKPLVRNFVCGGGGEGGGEVIMFHDTFSDSDSTAIAAHTPDVDTVGGGWTVENGGWTIQSNEIDDDSNGSFAWADCGAADCTITATVRVGGSGRGGIVVRHNAYPNNGYYWVELFANTDLVRIMERTSTNVLRASTAVTIDIDTNYALRIVLSGSTITATVDGGAEVSYASATNYQASTKHGVVNQAGNQWVDDFKVVS